MDFENKELLVVGLARSGLAAANFLVGRGAKVTVTDLKSEKELRAILGMLPGQARLRVGGHRREDFLGADTIVLSPGVPKSIPELKEATSAGVEVISEVELAFRFLKGPFVGVTGSNGKTTTTTLIGEILKRAGKKSIVGGNIGTPLTSFIDDPAINSEQTTFVVELSSFQLESIVQLKCHIALLLNITPDHMDRYPSFAAYRQAKGNIFHNQTKRDFAIVNADDANALAASSGAGSTRFPYSCIQRLEEGAFLEEGKLLINWEGQEVEIAAAEDIRLRGTHNIENTLAAASTAFLLELPMPSVTEAIQDFPGVEHRLEMVRRHRQVEYYNDSKATNVDSAIRAIEAFEKPLILIMGGLDKGTDFSPLRTVVSENVKKVILLGRAAEKLALALKDAASIEKAKNLQEAVCKASRCASSGDVVLLAPACASFDMFRDYEHRGREFKRSVCNLGRTALKNKDRVVS